MSDFDVDCEREDVCEKVFDLTVVGDVDAEAEIAPVSEIVLDAETESIELLEIDLDGLLDLDAEAETDNDFEVEEESENRKFLQTSVICNSFSCVFLYLIFFSFLCVSLFC